MRSTRCTLHHIPLRLALTMNRAICMSPCVRPCVRPCMPVSIHAFAGFLFLLFIRMFYPHRTTNTHWNIIFINVRQHRFDFMVSASPYRMSMRLISFIQGICAVNVYNMLGLALIHVHSHDLGRLFIFIFNFFRCCISPNPIRKPVLIHVYQNIVEIIRGISIIFCWGATICFFLAPVLLLFMQCASTCCNKCFQFY